MEANEHITIKSSENALDTWCERGYFCRKHECAWWMGEWCELASRLTPAQATELRRMLARMKAPPARRLMFNG